MCSKGYNGAFGSYPKVVENRNTVYGNRTDGNPWVKPENIHPYRIYVGKKGFKEDGEVILFCLLLLDIFIFA